jgi:predicted nuclease of predicted toxin-antitoxin system
LPVRLLLDECSQAKLLVTKLVAAGHDVQTALQAGVIGVRDDLVFATAIANNRILLTINCADFIALSAALNAQGVPHPGVFLVYLQNDPNRDMSYDRIVKAITNLEETQVRLSNTYHSLNRYDF